MGKTQISIIIVQILTFICFIQQNRSAEDFTTLGGLLGLKLIITLIFYIPVKNEALFNLSNSSRDPIMSVTNTAMKCKPPGRV